MLVKDEAEVVITAELVGADDDDGRTRQYATGQSY